MANSDNLGGSTVDGMLSKMKAFEAMSQQERKAHIRAVTSGVKTKKLSDADMAMMMAADGYFQNADGDFE